jgi:hypothetical protein
MPMEQFGQIGRGAMTALGACGGLWASDGIADQNDRYLAGGIQLSFSAAMSRVYSRPFRKGRSRCVNHRTPDEIG